MAGEVRANIVGAVAWVAGGSIGLWQICLAEMAGYEWWRAMPVSVLTALAVDSGIRRWLR